MTQTDTMADIRCFFTPKPEPKPEPEPELEEAYRQGFKDALEDHDGVIAMVSKAFVFEPTLHDLAYGRPTMFLQADTHDGRFFRFPTTEEEDKVIWTGELFRFPIGWAGGNIKYVTYRAVLTGTTWTLREFVERAQMVYSVQKRKHLKAMGDHIFFEGFVGDTFHCGS